MTRRWERIPRTTKRDCWRRLGTADAYDGRRRSELQKRVGVELEVVSMAMPAGESDWFFVVMNMFFVWCFPGAGQS
jgi:hypothetical protein